MLGGDPELCAVVDRTLELIATQQSKERTGEACVPLFERPEWQELLARWRREKARVVVYGAGLHTRELLEHHDLRSVGPRALADRDPRLAGTSVEGLPVVRPEEIEALEPDVVVLSSRRYEDEIHAELQRLLPARIPLVRLYADPVPLRS